MSNNITHQLTDCLKSIAEYWKLPNTALLLQNFHIKYKPEKYLLGRLVLYYTADPQIFIGPDMLTLSPNAQAFIMLHEILHFVTGQIQYAANLIDELYLPPHKKRLINLAYDLIVNSMLLQILDQFDAPNKESVLQEVYDMGLIFAHHHSDKRYILSMVDAIAVAHKLLSKFTPKSDTTMFSRLQKDIENFSSIEEKFSNIDKNILQQLQQNLQKDLRQQSHIQQSVISTSDHIIKRNTNLNLTIKFKLFRIFKKLFNIDITITSDSKQHHTIPIWYKRPKSRLSIPAKLGQLPNWQTFPIRPKNVYLFIDVSGSITDQQLSIALLLAQHISQLHNITIHTFASRMSPSIPVNMFIKNPKVYSKYHIGKGTNFNQLIAFVNNLQQHPDRVIVLTDGKAPIEIEAKQNTKWYWIINKNKNTSSYLSKLQQYFQHIIPIEQVARIISIHQQLQPS